ncbi:MAG: thiamine biosynthesis protein ThiI [Hyphomicrobiaceae bacterium]|jgi:thiamine biosynthesis protein ThiI
MNDVVVVHYNEIALKLGHRAMFVGRLTENVRRVLADLPCGPVVAIDARILVELGQADVAVVTQRLQSVPGVANCLPVRRLAADMASLEEAVREMLETWTPSGSFAVNVRRAYKRFPLESPEIGRRLGTIVQEATGAPVNLRSPDEQVFVLVLNDSILVGRERVPCSGGLPVSTGGRVLLLLSGGIDSPVAGVRMQRRGCRLEALHFHSVPYLNDASQQKARELAQVIGRGQCGLRLTMVAFGDIQSEIVRFAPRPLRVVLYRRMMMRIASRMARRVRADALVTGESLGQVASQTLSNLSVIEDASALPVLRPLVGMDKLEISRFADQIGSYEISIQPDQDCCTLFVPRHPATAATLVQVQKAEEALDVDGMTEQAVSDATFEKIEPQWPDPRVLRTNQI